MNLYTPEIWVQAMGSVAILAAFAIYFAIGAWWCERKEKDDE
jgi:hypothetical protein